MSNNKYNKILYLPLDVALHLMALLPLRVLYFISDLIYLLVYHVARYRRKVVRRNLTESFPKKSEKEILRIERDFYHFFSDYFVETIKLLHISDNQMRRRIVFHDVDIIDRYFNQGRSILIYAAHYGNWEWLQSVTLWSRHAADGNVVFGNVYRPLKNEWFDSLFLHIRNRFHTVCHPKKTVFRDLLRLRRDGKLSITGFMSDQHPSPNESDHVIRFLNHDTAIITGSELLARKLDYVVLYFELRRRRRGYYDCHIRLITDDVKQWPDGSISDEYAHRLETQINEDPALWLWTHDRWKHKVKLTANDGTNK